MNTTETKTMNKTMNDMSKAAEQSKVGAFLTARQMAFKAHNLDKHGMTATTKDGGTWKWSNHFNVWACVEVVAVLAKKAA
jgi:hypothetical protein